MKNAETKKSVRIGILGAGKMGEALIEGLARTRHGAYTVRASTRSKQSAREVEKALRVPCSTDNRKLVVTSDVIVLCVKPHQAEAALRAVKSAFKSGKLLVSICAAIKCSDLRKWSGGKTPVIRTMPNTPCLVNEGITVLAPGPGAKEAHIKIAESIFGAVGRTAIVEEGLMDGATGLSGCGPAYMYLILESLSEAGVKVGLPRKTATLLAAQTMLGSAKMLLDRDAHPAALKDEVTTPAGCTIDGLMALEDGGLRSTLIKAVVAAAKRSATLKGN